METHSSTLAWRIPGTGEPGGLPSMGSHGVGHNWSDLAAAAACWAPTDLGSSSFSLLSFCLFMLFMGFSRQEYWNGLPFPSPGDHILSELSTMARPSWVALYGMTCGFIELGKAVVHVIRFFSFCDCGFQSVCPLIEKDRRLMEASWWEKLTEVKTESCSDDRSMYHAQ